MAQADYSISNQSFPATRADINSHLEAIATNNSGTSAPSTQYAGQFWIDTSSSNWKLYIHDGSDDIQLAVIDTALNIVNFVDSALASDVVINTSGDITTTGAFTSVGIDDNATSTAITIDSSEKILASQGTNWVGTVAESATSSVIEEGSNANGNFTKFADGTMICYTVKAVSHSTLANNSYTFLTYSLPISFVGNPSCIVSGGFSASSNNGIQRAVEIHNHDGYSWSNIWVYKAGTSTSQDARISLTAIGRWY